MNLNFVLLVQASFIGNYDLYLKLGFGIETLQSEIRIEMRALLFDKVNDPEDENHIEFPLAKT